MSAVLQEPAPNFRPMTEADIPFILEVENHAYVFPWSEEIFKDCLRVGYCCWLMELEDVISAYGIVSIAAGESHVMNLCVNPEYHGMGFGRMMLDFMLDVTKKHNVDNIFLEVRPSNSQAKRLYESAGFCEVGIRKDYYPAEVGREDAIIMALTLI